MQFLLADNDRLEADIKSLLNSDKFDQNLLSNMNTKKSRQLNEASEIDKKIQILQENL